MRRAAIIFGLGCAISALAGCSLKEMMQPLPAAVANDVALDRAIRISSLTASEQPFHLLLEITPPEHPASDPLPEVAGESDMRATVELFWLNRITYRTVIRSTNFSQIRIVNGPVVEEHDTGDFYPRWIQNFVDAILDPVPKSAFLSRVPGSVNIGTTLQNCIDTSALIDIASSPALTEHAPEERIQDEQHAARVCFRDSEPRIASGMDFTRYVAFDDFAPFGEQQIARTLINDLPANLLLRGRVTRLERLSQSDYALLKAHELTPASSQIKTTLVSQSAAALMLETPLSNLPQRRPNPISGGTVIPATIYIRTDRTGKVREAYRNIADQFHQQDAAIFHALNLKFKPLIVNGTARQMEAPFAMPR
jgi:hypothetical protein